jgi:hypothetical protein
MSKADLMFVKADANDGVRRSSHSSSIRRSLTFGLATLSLLGSTAASAQFPGGGGPGGGLQGGGGQGGGLQGGVIVDAQGVLRQKRSGLKSKSIRVPNVAEIDKQIARRSDLRRVSLKQLDAELIKSAEAHSKPTPEIEMLAGLYRIDYVIFDDKNKDVLLVGPAEGWSVVDGREVGRTSKRPTLHLEDLVVSLRTNLGGAREASCSIDPTKDGLASLSTYDMPIASSKKEAESVRDVIGEKVGLQTVRTGGVPEGSRFALVMVEADYRMKRLALGGEKIAGVVTHLDALVSLNMRGKKNTNLARWWFTPGYQEVASSADGSVYSLKGPALKLMNEEVLFDDKGERRGTGRSNPDWDKYSDSFNEHYEKLQSAVTPFADLRNLFDLMMVGALIERHQAADWFAGGALLDGTKYKTPTYEIPARAETVVNYRLDSKSEGGRKRALFTVAFGGVSMNPGAVLNATAPKAEPIGGKLDGLAKQTIAGSSNGSTVPNVSSATASSDGAKATADVATPNSATPSANSSVWWGDLTPIGKSTAPVKESRKPATGG